MDYRFASLLRLCGYEYDTNVFILKRIAYIFLDFVIFTSIVEGIRCGGPFFRTSDLLLMIILGTLPATLSVETLYDILISDSL